MLTTSRLLALALCFSLAACSGGASNNRLDYKEAKNLQGLDVPPDLLAPENTGVTELPGATDASGPAGILPQLSGVRIARDGTERWLQLDAPVERLWPRLHNFWATLGLVVEMDKPELGIMETAWAENRADAPSGFLTDWVKAVFKNAYAAGTRDKYRLRLERAEGGGTELFLTHYGLKEVVAAKGTEVSAVQTRWETRPSDPELAIEVMSRLALYLGGSEQLAAQLKAAEVAPDKARFEGDGLKISEGFVRSWRLVGIALDRLGVVVEDRNRAAGVYYVGQIDLQPEEEKKGWFSSLFAQKDERPSGEQPQLQVVLQGDEVSTQLSILNMDGTPRRDQLARELLKRLQQELK